MILVTRLKNIMDETLIPDNPDYGTKKVTVTNEFFFSYNQVLQTMNSLKSKKCYGYDNVPLLVLIDGAEVFASPLSKLRKFIKPKKYQTNGKSQEPCHFSKKETRKTPSHTDPSQTSFQQVKFLRG